MMRVSRDNYFALAGFQIVQSHAQKPKGSAADHKAIQALAEDETSRNVTPFQELLPADSLKKIHNDDSEPKNILVGESATKRPMTPSISWYQSSSRLINFLDRAQGAPSQEANLATIEFFEADRETADAATTNTDIELSQNDLNFLRSAIEDTIQRELIVNPTSSSDDINALLDSSFAEGISAILTATRTDDGDGNSSIRLSQIAPADLTTTEHATLVLASESAASLYKSTRDPSPQLDSLQAKASLEDLSRVLGKAFDPDLGDLERGFYGAVEGGASRAIDALSQKIENTTWLTDDQKTSALRILEDLSQHNTDLQKGLSTPSLFEDLPITFRSGSYLRAFSPDEVSAVIEATPNLNYARVAARSD